MMILWIVLSTIGGIIVLVLLIAAITKKSYGVERSIVVNKPLEETFHAMSSLEFQDSWSKWANLDPNMKKQYIGTDRTVGFISRWESPQKNVGEGEQEITKIIPNQRMETEIRFMKPMKAVCPGYFDTVAVGENQTKVTWGFNGKMPYPFNLFLLIMNMEVQLGKDFEEGLETMKQKLEG